MPSASRSNPSVAGQSTARRTSPRSASSRRRRNCAPASAASPTARGPVEHGLGLYAALQRPTGAERLHLRPRGGLVAERQHRARLHDDPRVDRAGRVLALELAELPLARHHPEGIGDARLDALLEVLVGAVRLQPVPDRHRRPQAVASVCRGRGEDGREVVAPGRERLRADRPQPRVLQRLHERGDDQVEVPRGLFVGRDRQQEGLRWTRGRRVEVEGDARRLSRRGDALDPLVHEQPGSPPPAAARDPAVVDRDPVHAPAVSGSGRWFATQGSPATSGRCPTARSRRRGPGASRSPSWSRRTRRCRGAPGRPASRSPRSRPGPHR